MKRIALLSTVFVWLLFTPTVKAQHLTVQTQAGKQVFSLSDLQALPRVEVTAREHSSEPVKFQGVTLETVLDKAGVRFGESLKGKRLASCLLVEAADGYRVVIALPEIDPAFTDKRIVLAYLRDGKPLDGEEGPYRIVIPDEKRMARWVRQVTTLTIVEIH